RRPGSRVRTPRCAAAAPPHADRSRCPCSALHLSMASRSGVTMARLEILILDELPPLRAHAAPCAVSGVHWSKRITPEGYPLWGCVSELVDAAELRWSDDHGDEAVYVVSGELEAEDRVCPADGALIVDAGAPGRARARGTTEVVHLGSAGP